MAFEAGEWFCIEDAERLIYDLGEVVARMPMPEPYTPTVDEIETIIKRAANSPAA